MRTKIINYRIIDNKTPIKVEGAQINLFTAARKIVNGKKIYWIVDHIPTGSKIWICDNYIQARVIGTAFLMACAKPQSEDNTTIQESTDKKFKEFLHSKSYLTIENYSEYSTEIPQDTLLVSP